MFNQRNFRADRRRRANWSGCPASRASAAAEVWPAYRRGEIQAIRDYCEVDVVNTYLLFQRFQVVRGLLTHEALRRECALLRETLERRPEPHWRSSCRSGELILEIEGLTPRAAASRASPRQGGVREGALPASAPPSDHDRRAALRSRPRNRLSTNRPAAERRAARTSASAALRHAARGSRHADGRQAGLAAAEPGTHRQVPPERVLPISAARNGAIATRTPFRAPRREKGVMVGFRSTARLRHRLHMSRYYLAHVALIDPLRGLIERLSVHTPLPQVEIAVGADAARWSCAPPA